MAKSKKNKNGNYTLMVTFKKKRRNLTLGKISKTVADSYAANIQCLIAYRKLEAAAIPAELQTWVQMLAGHHLKQLSDIGLLSAINPSLTVGELIKVFREDYDDRKEIEASSKTQMRVSIKRFPDSFYSRKVSDLEPKKDHHRPNADPVFSKDAVSTMRGVESWQREHYAKSSWSKANSRLRQVGKWAVERGYCDHNPFSNYPAPGEINEERNQNVEREWVDDAMDMCLDPDTRLLFCLGRYAAFRLPSEARTLKPKHVDWNAGLLQVFDSKKKKLRTMPLFDRVREELERHRDEAGWDRFVLTDRTRRNTDVNNYGLMLDAIERTEWQRWVRLRQNLRSSCENDLLRQGFDERLVSEWVGHTVNVSRKHYQKQSLEDYASAISKASF